MGMQDLLDKIEQRAAARPEHPVPPPVELIGFVVRWERSLRLGAPGASAMTVGLYSSHRQHQGCSRVADGEAIIRLGLDLKTSTEQRDFFAPTDWKAFDDGDGDLGGVNALPLDVPGPNGNTLLILALGKDGKAYLLDRTILGGIGGARAVQHVARNAIRTAPAVIPTQNGSLIPFEGSGTSCPNRISTAGLTVLKIEVDPAPNISTAWCGDVPGRGAPIISADDDKYRLQSCARERGSPSSPRALMRQAPPQEHQYARCYGSDRSYPSRGAFVHAILL